MERRGYFVDHIITLSCKQAITTENRAVPAIYTAIPSFSILISIALL